MGLATRMLQDACQSAMARELLARTWFVTKMTRWHAIFGKRDSSDTLGKSFTLSNFAGLSRRHGLCFSDLATAKLSREANMKKGIYETEYGNVAYVAGPKTKRAWDLDMGEYVPIENVLAHKFICKAQPQDSPRAFHTRLILRLKSARS